MKIRKYLEKHHNFIKYIVVSTMNTLTSIALLWFFIDILNIPSRNIIRLVVFVSLFLLRHLAFVKIGYTKKWKTYTVNIVL